jgi:hypothetical protein
MSWNLGASASWNSHGLSRSVRGLLYLWKQNIGSSWKRPGMNTDDSAEWLKRYRGNSIEYKEVGKHRSWMQTVVYEDLGRRQAVVYRVLEWALAVDSIDRSQRGQILTFRQNRTNSEIISFLLCLFFLSLFLPSLVSFVIPAQVYI